MKITIEIDSEREMDKLSALLETFKIDAVKVMPNDDAALAVTKGDKSIDPKALFGIWADKPRTLDSIRDTAWKRK